MLWTYKTTVIYPLGYSIYKLINKHQPSTTGRKPITLSSESYVLLYIVISTHIYQ